MYNSRSIKYVDVIGEGHHQVPLLLIMQLVDGMDKIDQLLCRADWQNNRLFRHYIAP